MTGAQTLAAFRRAAIPAVAVGLALMALVVAVMLSRPPAYQARLGLVAASNTAGQTDAANFGSVVAMTMQALPELAVSDGVIKAVREQVPGAPDAGTLRNSVTVELVPASGVARISVQTNDQRTTIEVLKVLVAQIQAADLLAPVAKLKPIGSGNTSAQLVERDPKLALGLGLVAAVISSLLTVVLVQTVRPRLLTAMDVEGVVDEVFEANPDAPPVVDLRQHASGLNLLAAHLLSQDPRISEVTVVPAGPAWRGDLARQLRGALRNLRVARDVGLPADPFAGTGTDVFGLTDSAARHAQAIVSGGSTVLPGDGWGGRPGRRLGALGGALAAVRPQRGPGVGIPVPSGAARFDAARADTSHSAGNGTNGVVAHGSGSNGSGANGGGSNGSGANGGGSNGSGANGGGANGGGSGPDGAQDGSATAGSHLVVTVRLGRTTPVALATALIALRTHGTGVAALAVS